MKLKIIVDSTFNLEEDFIKENDITVIPLNVIVDGKTYQDGIDISFDEVMEAANNDQKVSTSQPSPQLFIDYYQKLRDEGATDILCLTISSTLSGTFNSAILAKEEVEGVNIHVVDTLSTAIGSEIFTEICIEDLKAGKPLEEVISKIERIKHTSGIIMNMENLNALKRSGRISRIKATIGNLLRVKPIIEFFEGRVEINSKLRTEAQVIEWIIDKLNSVFADAKSKIYIYMAHIRAKERVLRIKEHLDQAYPNIEIKVRDGITPVIAVNLGYGGFGIAWCYE